MTQPGIEHWSPRLLVKKKKQIIFFRHQHCCLSQLYNIEIVQLEKEEWIHKWRSSVDPTHRCASVGRPARTYLHQLVQTQNVVWKTCQEWWMIGTDGEKESGKSVLSVWLDEDDDETTTMQWYAWILRKFLKNCFVIPQSSMRTTS